MPSPCCDKCKETCAEGEKCGTDCKCGPSCKCCEEAGTTDTTATAEKCHCKADGKCSCPEGSCTCN